LANKRENPNNKTNSILEINALIKELRVATLKSVHIIITTYSQVIRLGFGEKYEPSWFIKDKDPISPIAEIGAVIMVFPSLDFGILVGNSCQNILYSKTY
jgi:hypothetical protein